MSEESQADIRARLVSERGRLQHEMDSLQAGVSAETFQEDEGADTVSTHPADAGSEMFEREKNLTVMNTLQISLDELDAALAKVDAGTYGSCENCGKPIGEKRLNAMPAAVYCIDCQSVFERTGALPKM